MSKYVRDKAHCKHESYTKEEIDDLLDDKLFLQPLVCVKYREQEINNATAILNMEDCETTNIWMNAINDGIDGGKIEFLEDLDMIRVKCSAYIDVYVGENNTSVIVQICKVNVDEETEVLKQGSFNSGNEGTDYTFSIPNYVASVCGGETVFVRLTTTGTVTVKDNSHLTLETLDFVKTYE